MEKDQIDRQKREEAKAIYNKHRVTKFIIEAGLRTVWWCMGESQSTHPEKTRGLIEGAILGNNVTYPQQNAKEPRLIHSRAPGGQWIAYDFNRPNEFPIEHKQNPFKQKFEGRLHSFILDEIRENEAQDCTPTMLFDITNLMHLLTFDRPTVDTLTDIGLVELTTHGQAYENVGLYDMYGHELGLRRVEDDPVFQVTPKGNTLIHVIPETGDPEPKEAPQKIFEWLPGLRPAPAYVN